MRQNQPCVKYTITDLLLALPPVVFLWNGVYGQSVRSPGWGSLRHRHVARISVSPVFVVVHAFVSY